MPIAYDLTQLDPRTFEHMVNALALRVLGSGHTEFGPGPDGGRDGYFHGGAPYPSESEQWSGVWYVQSKFHQPHLSKDPQKWLLEQIENELKAFQDPASKRRWPDIWIVATNIDPSGTPMTGSFDRAKEMVGKARPELGNRFHIWGGGKILNLLADWPNVTTYYGHFLTPGHILTAMYEHLKDDKAEIETVLRHLIIRQFEDHKHTKLEQAGSDADSRPGIHQLFIDVPFSSTRHGYHSYVVQNLMAASSKCHRFDPDQPDSEPWRQWRRHPRRARVHFVRGGPGQGKSTVGQYFCQIQRAALILAADAPLVTPATKTLAKEVRKVVQENDQWPNQPRIPVYVELKDFAQWIGRKDTNQARGVLTYVAEKLAAGVEQQVNAGTLKRALGCRSWFFLFDGLDEVPQDVKDLVAREVRHFVDEVAINVGSDILTVCTSRPQGYAGQFDDLDGPTLDLTPLSAVQALACARPVLVFGRSPNEAAKSLQILESAMQSRAVVELMTTPLQAHIMAVVVRDGGRPPERRWQLYNNFYDVIKRREANRDLPDERLSRLLREDSQLLKTVHSRLGYVLHSRAETSAGAQTNLSRAEFKTLVFRAVRDMLEGDVTEKVAVLMEATVDRLVLVSTPDDGQHVRFDIRPLQEFFAAEYLYEQVDAEELRRRLDLIAGDAHWREVTHFLLSALVENGRRTELSVAVEVLHFLNDGATEGQERILLRQLCKGGILAARLLQEGVLEQDKRVRQEFRHALQPLLGVSHESPLDFLIQVHQPNSLLWLRSFLMDHLIECDASEHYGALYIMMHTTRSDNADAGMAKARILSASPALRGRLLEHGFDSVLYRLDTKLDEWTLDLIVSLLCVNDWWKMGVTPLHVALRLLVQHMDDTIRALEKTGRSSQFLFVTRNLLHPRETQYELQTDYGMFKEVCVRDDWTGSFVDPTLATEGEDGGGDVAGFFALAEAVMGFGCSRSHQYLVRVLEVTRHDMDFVSVLPDWLCAQIPYLEEHDFDHVCGLLRGTDTERFARDLARRAIDGIPLKRRKFFREWESGVFRTKPLDAKYLDSLIQDHPVIAVSFDMEKEFGNLDSRTKWVTETDYVSKIVDAFLAKPKELLSVPWIWGKLFTPVTDKSQSLRDALVQEATRTHVDERSFYSPDFAAFRLDLPKESVLLPYFLQGFLGMLRMWSKGRPEKATFEAITSKARDTFPSVSYLHEVASSTDNSLAVRCAAVLVAYLVDEDSKSLYEFISLLQAAYVSGTTQWLVSAVANELLLFDSDKDPYLRAVVAALLSSSRDDWNGKRVLQRLLHHWRESSHAPLHEAGNPDGGLLDIGQT